MLRQVGHKLRVRVPYSLAACSQVQQQSKTLAIRSFYSIHRTPSITVTSSSSSVNLFHSSCYLLAKAKKKGGDDSGSEAVQVSLPDIKVYEGLMEKRIVRLEEEFSKLRGGRVGSDMLNHIVVELSGGGKMRLVEISQISMKNQSQMVVSVFDAAHVSSVVSAIRDSSGMALNPSADGSLVMVSIPKPSKESRDLLIKDASKLAEKTKSEIRTVRKDCMDALKKLKGKVSEDDTRKQTKDVDSLTEKKLEKVSKLLKEKEAKLME